MLLGIEHGDFRRGAARGDDQVSTRFAIDRLRHEETAKVFRLRHGGGKPDGGDLRSQPKQPRQIERQQIAAFRRDQRMQFVQHHALERAEQKRRVGTGEQQRDLFRRGEQNVRRIAALALTFRHRRVAGAGLEANGQTHFRHRRFEVARDVHRKRLQRRNVQRVQPALAADIAAGGDETLFLLPSSARIARGGEGVLTTRGEASYNSTSVGRNPASVLPAPVGAISSVERPACAFASKSS